MKSTVFVNRPKLCGNCAHFHTRKLDEITVFYTVFISEQWSLSVPPKNARKAICFQDVWERKLDLKWIKTLIALISIFYIYRTDTMKINTCLNIKKCMLRQNSTLNSASYV